jgi:hypothetical protein
MKSPILKLIIIAIMAVGSGQALATDSVQLCSDELPPEQVVTEKSAAEPQRKNALRPSARAVPTSRFFFDYEEVSQ